MQAFKKGFSMILPMESLRPFDSKNEIEVLICGESKGCDGDWKDPSRLEEEIVTAHGYNHKSRAFRDFIRYLTELEPRERPCFLKFITGSPRLPVGGFGALNPKMTIVLKKPTTVGQKADNILPSVMTCQNYVKMPEYSSYEVLKAKFDCACKWGADNFALS